MICVNGSKRAVRAAVPAEASYLLFCHPARNSASQIPDSVHSRAYYLIYHRNSAHIMTIYSTVVDLYPGTRPEAKRTSPSRPGAYGQASRDSSQIRLCCYAPTRCCMLTLFRSRGATLESAHYQATEHINRAVITTLGIKRHAGNRAEEGPKVQIACDSRLEIRSARYFLHERKPYQDRKDPQ